MFLKVFTQDNLIYMNRTQNVHPGFPSENTTQRNIQPCIIFLSEKIFFENFARREGLKTFSVVQCTDNLLTSLTYPAQALSLTNRRAEPATGQGMRVLIGQGEQKGRSGRGTQPMRGKVDGSSKS